MVGGGRWVDVVVVVGVTFAFQLLYNAASSVQNEKGGVCKDVFAMHRYDGKAHNALAGPEPCRSRRGEGAKPTFVCNNSPFNRTCIFTFPSQDDILPRHSNITKFIIRVASENAGSEYYIMTREWCDDDFAIIVIVLHWTRCGLIDDLCCHDEGEWAAIAFTIWMNFTRF